MATYDVKDKVFLVTGAATGIGSGVVRALLAEDAKHVAILDVNVGEGQDLEKELNAKYGQNKAKFYKCDVTTDELGAAFNGVIGAFGYIDAVINNAAIMNEKPEMFVKEININVTAVITSTLKAYELMRKDRDGKGGTVINISSIAALMRAPAFPVYSATKSAVLTFSNILGMKAHFNRSGVRVVTVCFGVTNTNLLNIAKVGTVDSESEKDVDEMLHGFPGLQTMENAVSGLVEAYKNAASASTWLVSQGKPAVDISEDITDGFRSFSKKEINESYLKIASKLSK